MEEDRLDRRLVARGDLELGVGRRAAVARHERVDDVAWNRVSLASARVAVRDKPLARR